MTLYKNKYRVESIRLPNWDYGWNARYFITVVTKNREHYFGKIDDNNKMNLTDTGIIASRFWFEIPGHFPFVILNEFIVMPNHIHGIVIIDKKNDDMKFSNGNGGSRDKARLVSTVPPPPSPLKSTDKLSPGQKRFQNPGKNNISSIIGSYKSVVSKNAHKINPDFNWQSRFHDHIIRDEKEFNRVRNYIRKNPANWSNDTFCK